jgi:hypothetical protein
LLVNEISIILNVAVGKNVQSVKIAVGQKCRRSKLPSVKIAVGEKCRWSKWLSVKNSVGQKFRRSKWPSVKAASVKRPGTLKRIPKNSTSEYAIFH